ncbi:MAG: hypothetical protein SCALA702_09550 [Melioribacteraceae bacterium]|nr:MAG: hypothetical protein SCALA702_09550 [Melioribacteraceae bacterium]
MVLFLFVVSLSSAQTLEDNKEAGTAYNEGNALRKAGNYAGALEKYDLALQSVQDYRVYYQKGIVLKKLNKYSEAEEAFAKCITANAEFALAYNSLGGTYFIDGKYQEAIDNFLKFKELATKKSHKEKADEYIARSYAKLGLSAKNDGKFKQSIDYLKKAVEHFDYDAAYLALAQVYVEQGEYDSALEAADKAANYRKSIPKGGPYYFKGLAFKNKKDLAKARENFEIAKKDPQYKTNSEYELKLMR